MLKAASQSAEDQKIAGCASSYGGSVAGNSMSNSVGVGAAAGCDLFAVLEIGI
jgi:hypothetical protein